MSNILNKLDRIIIDQEPDEDFVIDDSVIIEKMIELITSIDPDYISDEQANEIIEILDLMDLDHEDVSEVFKKRVKRDLAKARSGRRERRQQKTKLRLKGKRYRRSAAGK